MTPEAGTAGAPVQGTGVVPHFPFRAGSGARRGCYGRAVQQLDLTYLNGPDVERLALTDNEILDAVEAALRAQGEGKTVLEPRVHLNPDPAVDGHFNVLRGVVLPLGLAGVKVVGDFLGNYRVGLPSELALLVLMDPGTGQPRAIVDATGITEMRTGAVTALGARHLAPTRYAGARPHRRSRHRVLERPAPSPRCSSSTRSACTRAARKAGTRSRARLEADLGRPVNGHHDWETCVRGAGVVVEASRLERAPNRCCGRNGSSRARSSSPTAR